MPATPVTLTKDQINLIKARIRQEGVKTSELAEDLLDHFCVAIEEEMREGEAFESALKNTFNALQEDELKITEMKTQELLEGKKTYYPNLLQSFGLLLMAFATGWLASKGVQAISIGIADPELRQQWYEQNYLLISGIMMTLSLGVPIGYTIWRKIQTQVSSSIFSFRPVPLYVYGIILLVTVFAGVWLEPLAIFSPFFQQRREAELLILGNFDPLLVGLVVIGITILLELLFRGVILKGLLMTTTPGKAIFWSSVLCGIAGLSYFFFYFFISLMLGWIYWKTRSLYPLIFFVIAINLISYIILPLIGFSGSAFFQFTWWDYVDHNLLIYLPLVIGPLLLTVGLLYYLNRRLNAESAS